MTYIVMQTKPAGITVHFRYDPELVALIKECVPSYSREWDATRKRWTITEPDWAATFARAATRAGHEVDADFDWEAAEQAAEQKREEQRQREAERAKERVRRQREEREERARQNQQRQYRAYTPPPRFAPPADPFVALLRTVGPARADAVFKALVRVLHPDRPDYGDRALFEQLDAARRAVA